MPGRLDYASVTNNPISQWLAQWQVWFFFFSLMRCIQYGVVPRLTEVSFIISSPTVTLAMGRESNFLLEGASLARASSTGCPTIEGTDKSHPTLCLNRKARNQWQLVLFHVFPRQRAVSIKVKVGAGLTP